MRSGKNVVVAVNKIDNTNREENIYNFYELGFGDVLGVSGEHNIGIVELLDRIVADFKPIPDIEYSDDKVKFCLIGRPNVGKSSLVNA